jgi:hypothetical protein
MFGKSRNTMAPIQIGYVPSTTQLQPIKGHTQIGYVPQIDGTPALPQQLAMFRKLKIEGLDTNWLCFAKPHRPPANPRVK